MIAPVEKIPELIEKELTLLWAAHEAVGLEGYMCLYSPPEQIPFRNKEPGITFWFGKNDTKAAIEKILEGYNNGHLPNTTLLLNPIVHKKIDDDTYEPIGSGFMWASCLALGVSRLSDESIVRIHQLGCAASLYKRGDNDRAGLKVVTFCDEMQPAIKDKNAVEGCKELYDIADVVSPAYAEFYMLSGISYLTNNGLFQHSDMADLLPEGCLDDKESMTKFIEDKSIPAHKILEAAFCWESYERHHSLYQKFGTNPDDVAKNLQFFNLVARDVELFDATGPMRKDAEDMFEFLVPGLIPRGTVSIVAATGGTGKSSICHQLALMVATDYEKGEQAPVWLGQRVAIEKCKGIVIYFSGEDGPPILNARSSVLDPKGRAQRVMYQRTDFGEGVTFAQHIRRLHKVPDVPLMVIDPARKFLVGSEDDSEVVSNFFEAIEEFAIKKNTAVVLVHHLVKGAHPETAADIYDMLRGSQVFIDRARSVVGMFRDGQHTIMGMAKNNIPPQFGMVMEERVFARNPKNLDLIWLPGKEGIRNGALTDEELEELAKKSEKEGRK